MSQPTPYTPTTNFSQQEANNASGRSTVNTAALDAEFAGIDTTLDQTLANLQLIQRDDGKLQDNSVEIHTLGDDVLNLIGGFLLKGDWVASTAYVVNDLVFSGQYSYVCKTAHTSGLSFVDINWLRIGTADRDSQYINFIQSGTGAVTRTAQDKMREVKTSADWSGAPSGCVGVGVDIFPSNGPSAIENTALGTNIFTALTTGYANTGVGVDVLSANTTGSFNMGIGVKTLYKNTTGSGNTAFGAYSTYENKEGDSNTGYGEDSNRYLDGGDRNVAVGTQSLYNNVTGTENTAVGTYAARNSANPPDDGAGTGPSPTYLTAVGAMSLYAATGTLNTGIGHSAGYNTTGSYNSYLGANAGYRITSGTDNVFIGYNSGANASQLATASLCVALGKDSYTTGSNAVAIGSAVVAGANQIAIGNSAHTGVFIYGNINSQLDNTYDIGSPAGRYKTIYATTGTINTSDARSKQQISELSEAERKVAVRLKGLIRTFKLNDAVQEKGTHARIHVGVIAQDVKAAFEAEGLVAEKYAVICYDEWEAQDEILTSDGDVFKPAVSAGNRYGIRYEELLAFVISAL